MNPVKLMICCKIAISFDGVPDAYILPYVLNPLILLKLMHKFLGGVEIDKNNINSKLQ